MNAFELKKTGDDFFAKDKDKAISLYTQAIKLRPQFVGAYFNLAKINLERNQFIEAGNNYVLAWIHNNFDPKIAREAGKAFSAAEHSLLAIYFFEKVPKEYYDVITIIMYADALLLEARISEARALIEPIKDLNFITKKITGSIYLEQGYVKESYEILNPILNDDFDGYVRARLVGCMIELGKLSELHSLLNNFKCTDKKRNNLFLDWSEAFKLLFNREEKYQEKPLDITYPFFNAAKYFTKLDYYHEIKHIGSSLGTFKLSLQNITPDGMILEFGVRNGHSINMIASLIPKYTIHGFDSFNGIPESWGEEPAGSYTTLGKLPPTLENVELHVGVIEDTLPKFLKLKNKKISFINIDVDIYSTSKFILSQCHGYIDVGTIIVFDEYIGNPTWEEDEFRALKEYASEYNIQYKYLSVNFYTKQVAIKILSK